MSEIIKIFIVDEHEVFRIGVKTILCYEPLLKMIGEDNSLKNLLKDGLNNIPDILIADFCISNIDCYGFVKQLMEKYPTIKYINLSHNSDFVAFNAAIELGIDGYLLKTISSSELINAIHLVYKGNRFFSNIFLPYLKEELLLKKQQATVRELEILRMICDGYTTQEIADQLTLSRYTVEGYRKDMLIKFQVKNTAELVGFAFKNKLIE